MKEKIMKQIQVGNLDVPKDYFDFSVEDKKELCIEVMDAMLTVLDRNLSKGINRIDVLDSILENSILINQLNENYEVCQVLSDIRNLLNE